jgi:hypothetical protein
MHRRSGVRSLDDNVEILVPRHAAPRSRKSGDRSPGEGAPARRLRAISLPIVWSDSGLPIGVQVVGRFGEEHLLLQLAAQIEETERPPIFG